MFESAKLKIDRAIKHINDLRDEFNTFVDANPHTFVTQADPQTGNTLFKIRFQTPMSAEIGLILGDGVHNLRAALDHLVWELVGIDGGIQDRHLSCPTGDTLVSYKASCNGIPTPRIDTKKLLTGLEIYGDGKGKRLYGLHLLDNADKHNVITPLATIGTVNKLRVLNPDGSVAATMTDCGGDVGPDGYVNLLVVGPGMSIELDHDSKATPDIFFQNVDIFPFNPIVPTLMQLAKDVRNVRETFIKFIITRT